MQGDADAHVAELLGKYLRHRPEHGEAWVIYGESLRVMGRRLEAERALRMAIEYANDREKYPVYVKLGQLYSDSRPLEAEKWYKEATQSSTALDASLWELRGDNLIKLQKFPQAIECFEKGLGMPGVEKDVVYVKISLVQRVLAKYKEAAESLEKALAANPANERAKSLYDGIHDIDDTLSMISKL